MGIDLQKQFDDQMRAVWHECFMLAEMFYRYRERGEEFSVPPEVAYYLGCVKGALSANLPQQERNRVAKCFRAPQQWEPKEGEQQIMLCTDAGKVLVREDARGRYTLGVCPSRDPERWHGLMIQLSERQRADLVEFLGGDCETEN